MEYGGIYIHVPFCIRKCPYCNFYSVTELSYINPFFKSVIKEIKSRKEKSFIADSIYFGGGTPTLLQPEITAELISALRDNFTIIHSAEITAEANPGTINKDNLHKLNKAGINRLNIGVQSFNDSVLKILNRIHTAKEAETAYYYAREADFLNIGIDLIYAVSGQSLKDMTKDFKKAVKLAPEHISGYILTLEPKTVMYSEVMNKVLKKTDEDLASKMFLSAVRFLKNSGYRQYEISNFAKADCFRSVHNLKYWSCSAYKGFGPSAHSFDKNKRYWNVSDIKEYIQRIDKEKSVIKQSEILTKEQKIIEFIYLGLRHFGIDIKDFNFKFKADFIADYSRALFKLTGERLIKIDSDRCRLTEKGMLFADYAARILISDLPFKD
ncbi:MAG: radical SAM family heme chaperone HemW [Deltaproteobacteria bacterium]|nr:radical SAM family heme chaperone HemW [Deltaproteobacteria bacterium]